MNVKVPFYPADILLPAKGVSYEKWATIACDQFTSNEEYWKEVSDYVSDAPSCLKITLPEIYLNYGNVGQRIADINETMGRYLADGVLESHNDAMVFVERTLPDGKVRYGIVGRLDLEQYDFTPGSKPLIRPTEGTILSRIPPRVKIRQNAPIELPHVMLLIDDFSRTVIEPLKNASLDVLYDFDLMQGGGHIKGYLIPKAEQERIISSLAALADENDPFIFAVGDGNHSLATAKSCRDLAHPLTQFALAEIVNIHDDALVFEPIYRTVFNCDAKELSSLCGEIFNGGKDRVELVNANGSETFYTDGFCVGKLQAMLDDYLAKNPSAKIDYIHGEEDARQLAKQDNAVSFIFNGIDKSELFPYVSKNGVMPRKSFSMGEARSKRYYVEGRMIK